MTENNETETVPVEEPVTPPPGNPTFVFPFEVKYEDVEGKITSLYVKEGAITFRYRTDEEGNNTDDFVQICVDVPVASRNLLIHRYANPA